MQKTWTSELIADLALLWQSGISMSQIAKKLGTTRNAISAQADRMRAQAVSEAERAFWSRAKRAGPQPFQSSGAASNLSVFNGLSAKRHERPSAWKETCNAANSLTGWRCEEPRVNGTGYCLRHLHSWNHDADSCIKTNFEIALH